MSLQQIKVSREEVLKIVQENKEKHDQRLKSAIEGYWLEAETYLKRFEKEQVELYNKNHRDELKKLRKRRKEMTKSLKANVKRDLDFVKARTLEKGFSYWNGKYPEDHGDDYLGTIRRLELCVEPEVELDHNEFDSYIRNKWTWRDSFLTSNRGYVTSWYGTGSAYYGTSSYCCNANSFAVSSSWSSGSAFVLNTF